MPHFVVTGVDKPDSLDLRMATRQSHFDYVQAHPGVVRLAGPFLTPAGEMAGSMLIIEAADLAAAQAFSDNDPYTRAGLWSRVDVRPWKATVGQVP